MATVTRLVLLLFGLGFGAGVLGTVFGSGSMLGFGHTSVCVDKGHMEAGGSALSVDFARLKPGVRIMGTGIRACTDHPTIGQRLLFALQQGPGLVLLVGGLTLVSLLIRHATSDHIYSAGVADRLQVLGRFLVAGAVVEFVVKSYAVMRLQETMTNETSGVFSLDDFPWSTVLFGVVALTLARVIRIGVGMRSAMSETVEAS